MDLLERYLHAVRLWLPGNDRDDVVAELRDDLRSQIEEREAVAGRPLTESEVAEILKRCGRPIAVAGRYLPHPYLIGPSVFPIYRVALKAAALFYFVPWVVVWLWLVLFVPSYRADHPGLALLQTWSTFWGIALFTFGALTVVFASLERVPGRLAAADKWNPQNLPKVRDRNRIPRAGSIVELVIVPLFIAWWADVPRGFPVTWALERGGIHWTAGALWTDFHGRFYFPILFFAVLATIMAAVNLAFPYWTRARLSVRCAGNVASAVILTAVILPHRAAAAAQMAALRSHPPLAGALLVTAITDVTLFWTFVAAAIICLSQAAWEGYRIARFDSGPGRAPSGMPASAR